ncbi:MAG: hypothetical protein HYW85_00770, partial [Deltaproteobacteria bacterium]|nr:hypothetical protein [Deltaproteobacteria bacterium]
PAEIKRKISFKLVDTIEEVFDLALMDVTIDSTQKTTEEKGTKQKRASGTS